jgi:hypothetical protein
MEGAMESWQDSLPPFTICYAGWGCSANLYALLIHMYQYKSLTKLDGVLGVDISSEVPFADYYLKTNFMFMPADMHRIDVAGHGHVAP